MIIRNSQSFLRPACHVKMNQIVSGFTIGFPTYTYMSSACRMIRVSSLLLAAIIYNLPDCSPAFLDDYFQNDKDFTNNFVNQVIDIAVSALEVYHCFHSDLRRPNILFDSIDNSFKIIDWETAMFTDDNNSEQFNEKIVNYPLTSFVSSIIIDREKLAGVHLCEQLANSIFKYVFTNIATCILNFLTFKS